MLLIPYRRHTYVFSRPVIGIPLLLYMYIMIVRHRKHVYGPPRPVTGTTLLYFTSIIIVSSTAAPFGNSKLLNCNVWTLVCGDQEGDDEGICSWWDKEQLKPDSEWVSVVSYLQAPSIDHITQHELSGTYCHTLSHTHAPICFHCGIKTTLHFGNP
jgi:hypothetical protein